MTLEVLAIPLSVSLICWSSIALLLHGFTTLVSKVSSLKRYTAKQMFIALFINTTNSATSGGRLVLRILIGLSAWLLFFFVIFVFFAMLNVTFTEYPVIWLGVVRTYNEYMGPWIHQTALMPLKILDLLLKALIPIWNSTIWFFKTLLIQGVLPILIGDVKTLLDIAVALVYFFTHLTEALVEFITSFFCSGVTCLHPEQGILDVLTSMADVREIFLLGTQLLRAFCSTLAAPIDLLIYPFTDLNFAEGVHNLINSVLQLFAVIPRATVVRCLQKEDNAYATLMCTPDLAPFFNLLAAGLSSLGLAVDNWLNIAFLIIETVLGANPPQCQTEDNSIIPDLLANNSVFKSGTVVVGLTDWLYSVTDGVTALYMGHNDGNQAKIQRWPYSVDTQLGVAAVTYAGVHDLDVSAFSSGKTAGSMQTTAMLGCNCSDTDNGIQILCAILPISGIPTDAAVQDYKIQVLFSDPAATSMYVCRGVDIYVKPVRWSYTRYEAKTVTLGSTGDKSSIPLHDCISRGTCRELDATIWLIPRCGQDDNLNGEIACIPQAPCFPFCMAAREAGSGKSDLVMVRAGRWREGNTILGQDCALSDSTPSSIQLGMPPSGVASRSSTNQQSLLQSVGTAVYGFAQTSPRVCTFLPAITSVLPKNYSSLSAYGVRRGFNVILEGQPFAVTGDTVMTAVDLGGGASSVQVERLEGDEVDVFSLNSINQQLPSHPKAVVPLDQASIDSEELLTIPYNYQTIRIAATNSRNFVFYANNPNADVLGPYLEYCADKSNPEKLSKFGILFTSSYSVLRVYRVSAYRRCAAYSCGSDLIRFATIDGFSTKFGRECDAVFNTSIQALEYLNEDNIAVTVLSSRVTDWNSTSGEFVGASSTTYWLNPATMRLRKTIWQTITSATGVPTEIPTLCPALQRLPRLGSFTAELLNAGVFFIRFVAYAIAYTPGLVPVWTGGSICPAPGSALYHSVLANCGGRVYSLDDFFDSLDDAGAIFWHSLSLIARLIVPQDKPGLAAPIANVLDGMSNYGQGAVDIWATGAGVLSLTRVPISEQVSQLWATVQSGTMGDASRMIQGLASPAAGVLAWSRFTYKVVSTVTLDLLKRILDPLVDVTLADAFKLFWADVYDLKDEFSATVIARTRLACAGIKLMFGVENPWANLLYHQCAAGTEVTNSLMTLGLNIFVQVPMAKCVCKDVSSRAVSSYVIEYCAPSLPVSLLPTLYSITNQITGNIPIKSLACELVLSHVEKSIKSSLDPWFTHQFLALDALSSSVEYALATFDDKAGRCLDFQNDPHIVVIVPEPVDYFYRCGETSLCKQACSPEWLAFQELAVSSRMDTRPFETLTVSMESLFFPGELDSDLVVTNVTASVELPTELGQCLSRPANQQDFAIALAEVEWPNIRVQFWCVPQIPSSSVYRSDKKGYGPITLPGPIIDLRFGDDSGAWLVVLSLVGDNNELYLLNQTGIFALPSVGETMLGDDIFLRVENLWIIEGVILIDVLARRMTTSKDPTTDRLTAATEPVALHFTLVPPLGTGIPTYGQWKSTNINLIRFGRREYWYTKLNGWLEHLFLPKRDGLLPFRARIIRTGKDLSLMSSVPMAPLILPAMSDYHIAGISQNQNFVFATGRSGWAWLQQIRLSMDGVFLGSFGSAGVSLNISVKGSCDERGCDACATMQLQRLCLAYSKCALVNCIGTPVHQRRPLCGIGSLLRQTGRMGLLSTQGAWVIFTEMLVLTMQLNLLNIKEVYLLWPEDQFLSYMCQAKDTSAEFFSILTATINSVLQMGKPNIGYMYGGASNVDTNADAMLTITSTALNAFMHQLALFPLYGLAVSHQIMMCQVSGVIALVPTGDFHLYLRPAKGTPAADLIVGQCLTVGAEILATYPKDDSASLGSTVTSFISNALQRLLVAQIEPFLHIMDGFLAYCIGVVKALAGLVQAQNMAQCTPPDFFLKDIVTCACGDQVLQIPDDRKQEKLVESALWCTGVLGMTDSNNQPYYVYNPYSYAELQELSAGLANYTDCVRANVGYNCEPPNEAFFANQGVNTINILVKCRENFNKKRWDPAAYILYQSSFWNLVDFQGDGVPDIPPGVLFGVQECLADGDASSGSLVKWCLENVYYINANISAESYWKYERLNSSSQGPEYTDGCLAFSGPAEVKNIPVFKACVDGMDAGSNCTLAAHMWSPRSDNSIPVGDQHRVVSHGVNRDGLVQMLYSQAHTKVMEAIYQSLSVWNNSDNPEVNAEFFSVEGDILHQAMDCMFMGPYSRVDYWPFPPCKAGEECLNGPYWSRDENGGATRHIDPTTCTAPSSLPFTCGSPSRQSLMRYLVLQLLKEGSGQGNQNISNIGVILRTTLTNLALLWDDQTRYGCDCGTGDLSPLCCATNLSSPLLPDHLNKEFTSINSTTVLAALEDDMADLYNLALEKQITWTRYMQELAPDELASYNWSGYSRVTDEARFNPVKPTSGYTAEKEAMSPLLSTDSTLWDVCHASLKQVFFTLPTDSAGNVLFGAEQFNGDPGMLEEYVSKFTEEAFWNSPLFRHYSPRHAPSQSQMCQKNANAPTSPENSAPGRVQYSDFNQYGIRMLYGSEISIPWPVFHPQRFSVGEETCLCGWQRIESACYLPTLANTHNLVCLQLGKCSPDNLYYNISDQAQVLERFSIDWFCPEFELSPHFGFLDASAAEEWLGTNQTVLTTSSRDLYRHGRAGFRPGNVQSIPRVLKRYINPRTRQIPLERGRITTCTPYTNFSQNLVEPFLDQLFPAAQGIEEQGATVYCLRYAIELARLEVFRLLNTSDLNEELVLQREVTEQWRRRCGSQLHLLYLCTSLNVFKPLTDSASRDVISCRHFTVIQSAEFITYTTPQCLVSIDGVFYDPCRNSTVLCTGDFVQTITVEQVMDGTRLRFDPTTILRRGAPLGWIEGEHPLPDPASSLLTDDFQSQFLADPDAVGNVPPGTAWWDVEGPMSENSEFCDMVMDWWPDSWDFPVGYHVTVPCDANSTAYRGFSAAFALDPDTNTLVYQHDLLRDISLVDSHFGVTGLCRSSTFGMPMPETNNMRYCTQIQQDDTEDFAVPLSYGVEPSDSSTWSDWKCTTSSSQLPWPDSNSRQGSHQSSSYSIGTLPNMPIETSPTYPASESNTFEVGPHQDIINADNNWGNTPLTRCQDFDMFLCLLDSSCPSGFGCRGRVCTGDYTTACSADSHCTNNGVCKGVCLELTVACLKHSDCGLEQMCSGVGTCETPTLVLQNQLEKTGENISLGMAVQGTSCGPDNTEFSMKRASYWGNTGRDLLDVHGMCSFENWFKYTNFYSKNGCSEFLTNESFSLDPFSCNFVDLEQPSENQTKWWATGNLRPDLMFVRPTICDRDYERLEGFVQCAPKQGTATLLFKNKIMEQSELLFDKFVRLHNTTDSNLIPLAKMPEITSLRVGLLGLNGAITSMTSINPNEVASNPFIACGLVGQCFPSKFTVNGAITSRIYNAPEGFLPYEPTFTFICGSFGIQTSAGCILDTSRLPLYRAFCLPDYAVPSCRQIDITSRNNIDRLCYSIPKNYQASNQDRTKVMQYLRELFYVIPQFDNFPQYLKVTSCVADLYQSISNYAPENLLTFPTSLYYPFMYSLHEFPFEWFYHCIVMSGLRIQDNLRLAQNCRAYETRSDHSIGDYIPVTPSGDSFQTYLQFVKGWYLTSDVEAYRLQYLSSNTERLNSLVTSLTQEMFPSGSDLSFPRCSKNLLWRVGKHGNEYSEADPFVIEKRLVIWNWYDSGSSCTMNWHEQLLDRLEVLGIPRDLWVENLTQPDQENLVPQDGAGATSIIKEAVKFILGFLDISVQETVFSRGTGVIQFNNTVPSSYDHDSFPLPDSLRPTPSVNAGLSSIDESVNRTCVFLPQYDPAFTGLGAGVKSDLCQGKQCAADCGKEDVVTNQQNRRRVDYVRTCNSEVCTTIPVVYKRNGKFLCRYAASAVIDSTCSEESPLFGCERTVMDSIFKTIRDRFKGEGYINPPTLSPTSLPWPEESSWNFQALDLSEILDYERNIQPNPDRAVMCEVNTDSEAVTRFTECNNPHYLRLQQHVETHYKHDGSVIVPAGGQLEWPLQKDVLKKGVILSYASTTRPLRKRFLDALFNNETVCKGEPTQHVCRKLDTPQLLKFETVNPWTLGNFNPYEVCDVEFTSPGTGSREYIYTTCPYQNDPSCKSYLELAPPTCNSKHQRLVQQTGVPRFEEGSSDYNEYNLCHHTVEQDNDVCLHDQGLLGGFDGLPVASPLESSYSMIRDTPYQNENYTIARHLYENSQWSIPTDFKNGMLAGTNPLWQGDLAPYGHLQIDDDEIGGHRIGVVVSRPNDITENISTMFIKKLPLGNSASKEFLETESHGKDVQEWVKGLQDAMKQESRENEKFFSVGHEIKYLAPSCPLQRWVFYSGGYRPFSPSVPAAKRARHLFHRVHGGILAHPVMLRGGQGEFLGQYRTSNGFCACPVVDGLPQSQCLVPINDPESFPCSLRSTIQALRAEEGKFFSSYVFPVLDSNRATRFCRMQMDWPLVDGTLRDGTKINGRWSKASDPSTKSCHILDRFRPFRYKYTSSPNLVESDKNTVSHGVCKTSRLAVLKAGSVPQSQSRCVRESITQDFVRVTCNTTETVFNLPRRKPMTLAEIVKLRDAQRSRCSQCSKPPTFRSQQGRPIPPESSFGVLHRISPERLLAKDLRESICPPGATSCPRLNESAWRRGVFMKNYISHPEWLFLNVTKEVRQPATPPQENPALWTSKPWVYCPTTSSLASGTGCLGTMTRDEWVLKKTSLCPRMVRSISSPFINGSNGDPMARTTFCPIDSTTDNVCKAIAEARQLIIKANCIARGDSLCMPNPFVYHPATYEPSNNAWVHDTVKAYYTRIDQDACLRNSSTDQALLDFTRASQRMCPANGLNILVGVLKAVRVVVVDVTLLLTTMISMAFRTLQLIFTKDRDETKSQIGANWAYIRNKGRETLNTVGDLLVDTLLNSGEVGAKIMDFLLAACNGLNKAAMWFLNIWCNFIQKYMLQFLAGVRELLGIMGAGFEILQDFMDEIFQGILPAAFVAKYATGAFQDMLVEFYSEPTERKKKSGATGNVPDSANPRQVSKKPAARSYAQRITGYGSRVGKSILKASVYASMGLAAYDTVNTILSIAEEERLRKLYPSNFTLFYLSDIMGVVDDLEDFLMSPLSQDTCISYQLLRKEDPDRPWFTCANVDLKKYQSTAKGTTSIGATKCWANAAPSLGENSMFSCTASSTCCRTADCSEFILCSTCPTPAFEGINKYGCDSLRQMCTCSQPKNEYSRCSANRDCGLGSECELVSSLNTVSYGTIPCQSCPNTAQLMCRMPPTGMPARCSCMLSGTPSYDFCSDRSGTRTPVDSAKMCGYLHNRRTDLTRWVFDLDDLIMLPCSQVSTGICSVVLQGSTAQPLRMVVAENLRLASNSRRLLNEDQVMPEPGPPVYDAYESEYELADTEALHALLMAPGWNTTSAPCSTLAMAYQAGTKLGLLETHVLHRCGFWRYVGTRVIEQYNLSEPMTGHETFLLSMDDLVYAAMSPAAFHALLANPAIFVSAIMHHPWMKPVRALGVMVANQLEYLLWLRGIDADVHDTLFGDFSKEELLAQEKEKALARIKSMVRPRNISRARPAKQSPATPESASSRENTTSRHLLSVQDVLSYSAGIIQNPSSQGLLPARVYGAWSTSTFAWPPRYNYSLQACPVALLIIDIGLHVALTNKMYYENFAVVRPPVPKSLRKNLPAWNFSHATGSVNSTSVDTRSWVSHAFHWILQAVAVSPADLVAFFQSDQQWSWRWTITSLTQCDLASSLTCSRHDKDIIMSTVIFIVLFFLIRTFSVIMGVNFLSILFLLSYPWFILWYVFGMPPTCTLMLPTCLLSDIITTMESLLPRQILFPSNLVCESKDCFRSCAELDFVNWVDPLAFALCDTDDEWCTSLHSLGPSGIPLLDDQLWDPARDAMKRFQLVIRQGDIDGHRLCTWVSFVTVIPILALLASGFVLATGLLAFLFDLLPTLFAFVCQTVVFFET